MSERAGDAPESLESWIDRAREDFAAMQATARVQPPVYGIVCFHAHQCVEKLLKGCLIARAIRPPRTHNLGVVLDMCIAAGFDLEAQRAACMELHKLWPKSRYPDSDRPTSLEAQAGVDAATAVRRAILPLLRHPAEDRGR